MWGTFHCPSVRLTFWGVWPIFGPYSAEDHTLGGYQFTKIQAILRAATTLAMHYLPAVSIRGCHVQ